MIREKDLIFAAKVVSNVFSPFYAPLVAFILLFLFSYLSLLSIPYRVLVLVTVYCFTVFLPKFSIMIYRKMNGWSSRQLGAREKRIVPYAISFTSYIACLLLMNRLRLPAYMSGIISSALLIIIICSLLNIWWKVSTHMAGIGGLIGALISFSMIFAFNPMGWLCISLLAAGGLGTSRIVLRQHSLAQVGVGFLIGFVCSIIGILFLGIIFL